MNISFIRDIAKTSGPHVIMQPTEKGRPKSNPPVSTNLLAVYL